MESQSIHNSQKRKIRKVDCYLLIRPIGKGAFSTVYQGKIEGTNRKIAVKLISLNNVKKKDYERVQMQIKILSLIKHENIVELIDFKKSARHLYLVFEHCQNIDLDQHIKKYYNGIMPESIVKRVFVQIKKAFQVLRMHRIVHRDLKLANILVTEDFTIKVADFGFAGLLEDNMLFSSCVGTPLTMAPEVLDRKVYDQKCDIWSLGIMLYQMLEGTTPFISSQVMTLQALRERILNKKLVYNPQIPISKEVTDLLGKMIVNDPKQRMSFQDFFNHQWLRQDVPCPLNCLREVVLEKQIQKYLSAFVPNQINSSELVKYVDRILLVKAYSHYKGVLDNKLFNNITLAKKLIVWIQNQPAQKAKNVIFVALLILFSKIKRIEEEDGTLVINNIKIKMGCFNSFSQTELPIETEFSKSLPFLVKKGKLQLTQQLSVLEEDKTLSQILQTKIPILQEFFNRFLDYLGNGRHNSELANILLKIKRLQPITNVTVTSEYLSNEAIDLIVCPLNIEGLKKINEVLKDDEFVKVYKSKHNIFKIDTKTVFSDPEMHSLERLYDTIRELL